MKLAEALIRRQALKENIEQLKLRLAKMAKVQEGDTPAERPQELLAALEADLQDLQALITRINRANLRAILPDGTTLMEAIAKRDILKLRRGLLETLASSAVPVQERFTRTELKYVPTVDVAELRKEVDRLSKAYRELDASIQAAPLSAVEASQIRCSSSIIAPMPILGRIQKIPGVWRPAAK